MRIRKHIKIDFFSAELGIGEIHFRMSFHELSQLVLLFLFFRGREALLFLLLIVHHLFYSGASLSIKVRELGVLRVNLLSVNLGVSLDDTVPPVHLVLLSNVEL